MKQFVINLILCLILFMQLYPLLMTLGGALKNELDWLYSPWWPTLPLKIENLSVAWHAVYQYLWNTVVVAFVGSAVLLVQSSWGAFVFARMKFKGKEFLFILLISLMMVPGILTIVPSYLIYDSLGLINSIWVLIIPQWVLGPVFGVFLLRSFFSSTPEEIFEAARTDGCNDIRLYWSILIPLSLPIIFTLGIMNIINVWNDLIWPSVTIHDDNKMTIAYGLVRAFTSSTGTNMPGTFAGYVIASIPMILLFMTSSKYYVEGITSSAIKL